MRIGVLFNSARCATLNIAVVMARGEFVGAIHTRGHEPKEIHFNPGECPVEGQVGGLKVFANEQVPAGHIRITTVDIPTENELNEEIGAIGRVIDDLKRNGLGPAALPA